MTSNNQNSTNTNNQPSAGNSNFGNSASSNPNVGNNLKPERPTAGNEANSSKAQNTKAQDEQPIVKTYPEVAGQKNSSGQSSASDSRKAS